MALLVTSWSNGVESVPKDYVMPPERRAGDFVTLCKEIPVIDLQNDRSEIVQLILKACQEFGIFQVINHGVSGKMMQDMMALYDEFFNLPVEDKLGVYSEKRGNKGCMLYTSGSEYAKEDVHLWKDTLRHVCHPVEEHSPSWPDKPTRYREEVGRYVVEVRKVGFKILDLIAEGLGLNEGYFNGVSQGQTMAINHYPPCPDPSLAMGISEHTDINLITFLQQASYGLQIKKDGKWMGVDPIPNAFVVNLGCQLEIISNGKLKSVEHRGVLNSTASRTSIGTFFGPDPKLVDVVVEPAKELVTSSNPQMFKSHRYNEFKADYFAFYSKPRTDNGYVIVTRRAKKNEENDVAVQTTKVLPENYIFPVDERPGSVEVPLCQNIPLIDLSQSQSQTVQEILDACQEFGFFQVINHGVSEDLIDDTMKVVKEFFNMPIEEKEKLYSIDPTKSCKLYTSSYNYTNEEIHFWRDNLRHPCHPLDKWVHLWPEKPTNYRDVIGKYSLEVRELSLRMLELIREGLGLEPGYFGEELTGAQLLSINHYPRCQDPTLTLGLPKHADPNLITVLTQGGVYGLQVFKDGQWYGVEPLPHAFVVNIGHQLQIISNGKLRSAEHRAVTNSREAQTTIVSFVHPCQDTPIEPAKSMIDTGVPLFRPFKFKDFLKFYEEKKGDTEAMMEVYKLKP
ncbi:hypothetical protein L1987_50562 [Smallanthus sonchifolius]|uniref:Uncharacterized protein n=1 Tax=Smallanthus sonchifolius TaxID=185202 RepID=A0ACB9EN71_9ASTR|nr:hypothetical protein L1987_50562 [Smallanthus sonchifolius]